MPTEGLGEGQAGPSVVTLTKADKLVLFWEEHYDDSIEDCAQRSSLVKRVALAMEASEELAGHEARRLVTALRASEAALAEQKEAGREYVRLTDPLVSCAAWAHGGEKAIPCGDCRSCLLASRAEATKAALEGIRTHSCLCTGCFMVREALAAIRAPQPPEPVKVPCGRHGKDCHGDGSGSVADPDSVCPVWNVGPSSPPPPSEWKEPTKGSMTVGDLPYVLCPTCQKQLPRAGWAHTCKVPSPPPITADSDPGVKVDSYRQPPSEEPVGTCEGRQEPHPRLIFCRRWVQSRRSVPSPSPTREDVSPYDPAAVAKALKRRKR